MTLENDEKPRNLKRPMNLRHTTPRCCGTCKFGYFDNGSICCKRLPSGREAISDAENHYTFICDRYEIQQELK